MFSAAAQAEARVSTSTDGEPKVSKSIILLV